MPVDHSAMTTRIVQETVASIFQHASVLAPSNPSLSPPGSTTAPWLHHRGPFPFVIIQPRPASPPALEKGSSYGPSCHVAHAHLRLLIQLSCASPIDAIVDGINCQCHVTCTCTCAVAPNPTSDSIHHTGGGCLHSLHGKRPTSATISFLCERCQKGFPHIEWDVG